MSRLMTRSTTRLDVLTNTIASRTSELSYQTLHASPEGKTENLTILGANAFLFMQT
jgi:hypothetical protein